MGAAWLIDPSSETACGLLLPWIALDATLGMNATDLDVDSSPSPAAPE